MAQAEAYKTETDVLQAKTGANRSEAEE